MSGVIGSKSCTYAWLSHVLCSSTGQWKDDRELDVNLGLGATVVPETASTTACRNSSSIALLDGGIRTEAFAVMSSSGCVPILAPYNPPDVSAVLVAPQVII